MSDPETLGNVQAFVNQYAPHSEAQRKAFWKKFRKAANAYAGVQGQRIADLEAELAELRAAIESAKTATPLHELADKWESDGEEAELLAEIHGIPMGDVKGAAHKYAAELRAAIESDSTDPWKDANSLGIALRLAHAQNRDLRKELAAAHDAERIATENARRWRREKETLFSALTELRRWVADGDCSDDAGIWPGYATMAYVNVVKTVDKALAATPNLEETRSKLGVENQSGQEDGWVEVSKEEFYQYVRDYPNHLESDIARMCEPPLLTYNDFTLGNWPNSIVAKAKLYDGSEYHKGKNPVYYLPNDPDQP